MKEINNMCEICKTGCEAFKVTGNYCKEIKGVKR